MFLHDLKEKELNIPNMALYAYQAFLGYIYGNIQNKDSLTHRLEVLQTADKYDIADLKDACHMSLLEDIDTKNVLERLHNAHMYQLPELKTKCMNYLVKFSKIFEMSEDFNIFMQRADGDLISEVFREVFSI